MLLIARSESSASGELRDGIVCPAFREVVSVDEVIDRQFPPVVFGRSRSSSCLTGRCITLFVPATPSRARECLDWRGILRPGANFL